MDSIINYILSIACGFGVIFCIIPLFFNGIEAIKKRRLMTKEKYEKIFRVTTICAIIIVNIAFFALCIYNLSTDAVTSIFLIILTSIIAFRKIFILYFIGYYIALRRLKNFDIK